MNYPRMATQLGSLHGCIEFTVVGNDGVVKESVQADNLILDNMRSQLLQGLFGVGGNIAAYKIDRIGFGTSGTAADPSDQALSSPVYADVTAYSTPSPYSLWITATLGASEGNGVAYREMGLVMANNYLLSRVVREPKTKESGDVWNMTWKLTFTPAESSGAVFTKAGYAALFNILKGNSASPVARMQWGLGTDAPSADDVRLQVPISLNKDLASSAYDSDDGIMSATGVLLSNEANNFTITEAGLVTASGILVTRSLVTTQPKTSDYEFLFTADLS